MKKLIPLIVLFLVFALFALSLNLKNPDSITLNYYFGWQAEVDLYIVMITPFIIGLLLGAVLMSISVVRNKVKVGQTKRQLAKVEKEVETLRAAPAKSPPPLDDKISTS